MIRCRICGYDEPTDTIEVAICDGPDFGKVVRVTGSDCYNAGCLGVELETPLLTKIAYAVQDIHDLYDTGNSPVTAVGIEFEFSTDP